MAQDGPTSSVARGISFPKVEEEQMSLTTLFTDDTELTAAVEQAAGPSHVVLSTSSWQTLHRLVRERPVTAAGLDASCLAGGRTPDEALGELSARFPNLGLIVLSDRHTDPIRLFRLGRAGIPNLILVGVEDLGRAVPRALQKATELGATTRVTRALAPHLPPRELEAVRLAMDGVHHRWSADQFAGSLGISRPFLSERLKACGLPSTGHLLIWARLLHAGFWLEEPGRTGESVSRQLEYSSGAAFRRALKLYTGATPSQVVREGGLAYVLRRLLESCGLPPRPQGISAA
jgi:AraC-like DNA-binding protein